MNLVVALVISLSFYFHFLKCTHISQQQYYEAKRYLLVVTNKEEKYSTRKVLIVLFTLLSLIVLSLIFTKTYFLIIISVVVLLSLNYLHFNEKKPIKSLVITKRVKRLLIISYLLMATSLFLILNYALTSYIGLFLILLVMFIDLIFDYLYILFMFTSFPIEALIKEYYLSKARHKLKLYKPLIIAITGSYGKTTTKNIIFNVLSKKYRVLATKESYNTLMGITKTINEQLNKLHEIFVVEVGVDKVKGMEKFKKLFTPNYVIITAIGPQHLTTFKSVENIVKEKTKLIDFMKDDGLAFINVGSYELKLYQNENKNLVKYSLKGDSDVFITNTEYSVFGTSFDFKFQDIEASFKTPLLGKHLLEDVIVGILVGIYFKVDLNEIKYAISYLKSVHHRMEMKTLGKWNVIDDSYNSNPEGFKEALEILSMFPNKRILITPLLVELSSHRVSVLNDLAYKASKCCHEIILTSKDKILPFIDGLLENGFNKDNIKVFDGFISGFNYLKDMYEQESISLLIANDLPDYVL